MTALSLMRLVPQPAGRIVEGKVLFQGEDLIEKSQSEMQHIRGRDICMILQDPMSSLNPVFTVGDQLIETVRQSKKATPVWSEGPAIELLQKVKLTGIRLKNYPHQMSGGMRQRVVGAIATAGSPKVLIADEATTSLDATIQYQYLNLLKELQAETGMAIIFYHSRLWNRRQYVRSSGCNVMRAASLKLPMCVDCSIIRPILTLKP